MARFIPPKLSSSEWQHRARLADQRAVDAAARAAEDVLKKARRDFAAERRRNQPIIDDAIWWRKHLLEQPTFDEASLRMWERAFTELGATVASDEMTDSVDILFDHWEGEQKYSRHSEFVPVSIARRAICDGKGRFVEQDA